MDENEKDKDAVKGHGHEGRQVLDRLQKDVPELGQMHSELSGKISASTTLPFLYQPDGPDGTNRGRNFRGMCSDSVFQWFTQGGDGLMNVFRRNVWESG